jgi:hypothetical protein
MRKALVSLLAPTLAVGVWFAPAALAQDAGSGMTTVIPMLIEYVNPADGPRK